MGEDYKEQNDEEANLSSLKMLERVKWWQRERRSAGLMERSLCGKVSKHVYIRVSEHAF